MFRLTLAASLLLTACIDDRAPTAEGEPDAQSVSDGEAAPDAALDADAPDGFACLAVPMCPPGYDEVEACGSGAVCETIAACGQSILCQICPPGAGFVCPDGLMPVDACPPGVDCVTYSDCAGDFICAPCVLECPDDGVLVDACVDGDQLCERRTACGQAFACLHPVCDMPDPCPNGTAPVPDDVECDDCIIACGERCQPIGAGCPAHTMAVDGCLPGDPLCWVLDDGRACMSTACPAGLPCGGDHATAVDACAEDALGCFERDLCGEHLVCQVIAHDCDDCEPVCESGWRAVGRCAPNGRACERRVACCSEVFCEACEPADPDCGAIDGK